MPRPAPLAHAIILRCLLQEMGEIGSALRRHEGCNIHGWLDVQRVAGNIHFAVRPEALFLSMNADGIMQVSTQVCWKGVVMQGWAWCIPSCGLRDALALAGLCALVRTGVAATASAAAWAGSRREQSLLCFT